MEIWVLESYSIHDRKITRLGFFVFSIWLMISEALFRLWLSGENKKICGIIHQHDRLHFNNHEDIFFEQFKKF